MEAYPTMRVCLCRGGESARCAAGKASGEGVAECMGMGFGDPCGRNQFDHLLGGMGLGDIADFPCTDRPPCFARHTIPEGKLVARPFSGAGQVSRGDGAVEFSL